VREARGQPRARPGGRHPIQPGALLRDDWEQKARERAAALAPTLSRLTIVVPEGTPADVQVTRDGAPVVSSEIGVAIPVDPGAHVVRATASGRDPWTANVSIRASDSKTISVTFAASKATGPSGADDTVGSAQRTFAIVLGGVAVAGIAVGTIGGVVAMNKNNESKKDCPSDGPCPSDAAFDANESASQWAVVSTVGFISAGVFAAAAVGLWLTAPKSSGVAIAPRGLVIRW
jgi:hypothetical protein